MAEEISGEGFLNLLDTKITPLSGGDEKITVADQLEKILTPNNEVSLTTHTQDRVGETPLPYEGANKPTSSINRDIFNTLARGTGRDAPMKQATDQELDQTMMSGGLEVLRGGNQSMMKKEVYDELSVSSSYDEGGQGYYVAVEAADSATRARLSLGDSADHRAAHYALKSEKLTETPGAITRMVLPSESKILNSNEGRMAGDAALGRIVSDLSKMDQTDPRVLRALSIIERTQNVSNAEQRPLHEIVAGIDAITISPKTNEMRLLNRSIAVTSGTKTLDEIKTLYPQTHTQNTRLKGTGNESAARYDETIQQRYEMAQKRAGVIPSPNLSELREIAKKDPPPPPLTAEQQKASAAKLEQAKKSIEEQKLENMKALPATREQVKKAGFLYHFAPTHVRGSIDEKGLMPGQAQGPGKTFFFTDPTQATFADFYGGSTLKRDLDLYRVPVTQEILDSMKPDQKLHTLTDGTLKAVYLEGESASKGIKAERIVTDIKTSTVDDDGRLIPDLGKPKTPVDLSKLGTKADIKTAVQRAEKISTGQGKGEALASMSYRATGGQAVREISEQIASKPSSTGRMVRAVSQASAAVAAGKSGAMRKLGALTTIFRGK